MLLNPNVIVFTDLPSIIGISVSQTVALYSQLILTCNATGFPIPTIQWNINGSVYNSSDAYIDIHSFDALTIGTIIINSVVWNDAGLYECVVNNAEGNATKNVTISIGGK